PRNQISEQQAGKADPANTELYYLFQLGRPLQLANPVTLRAVAGPMDAATARSITARDAYRRSAA
ncbi:MAG: hypothetical protein KIG85_03500, partial [Thiopseudomonas sp.]|nr:hypothetical protein [Thiopseudomonas sp.]